MEIKDILKINADTYQSVTTENVLILEFCVYVSNINFTFHIAHACLHCEVMLPSISLNIS